MSEPERQQAQSPLLSERGVTTIKDSVVSKIAALAARGVAGVHMGGGASRAVLGNFTGADNPSRGISVNVGRVEVAIDLTMGLDYGSDFLQTVEEVRSRVTERVESLTGLRVVECNATITEVIFPDNGDARRGALESGAPERRAMPESEPGARESAGGPSGQTQEESRGGPFSEEEVRVEDRPAEEEETRVLPVGEAAPDEETREFARGPLAEDETDSDRRREDN